MQLSRRSLNSVRSRSASRSSMRCRRCSSISLRFERMESIWVTSADARVPRTPTIATIKASTSVLMTHPPRLSCPCGESIATHPLGTAIADYGRLATMPSCEDDAHRSADSGRPLSSNAFDRPSAGGRPDNGPLSLLGALCQLSGCCLPGSPSRRQHTPPAHSAPRKAGSGSWGLHGLRGPRAAGSGRMTGSIAVVAERVASGLGRADGREGAARCGPRSARVTTASGSACPPAWSPTGVHLERRSRLSGYCIVVWRHGHVAEPGDLDPLQAGRCWAEVLAAGRAVRAR